jgi:hypothetical protein
LDELKRLYPNQIFLSNSMSMVKPVIILVKARRRSEPLATETLGEDILSSLLAIQTEKIMRTSNSGAGASSGAGGVGSRFSSGENDNHSVSGASGFMRGDRRHHNHHGSGSGGGTKKPNFKKKVESFDEAMKNKVVSEMNKISPQNYDSVLQSLIGVYSRIADEEHPWVFRLILTNATRQHVFAELYINLYKDIMGTSSEDKNAGEKILQEFLDQHKETILSELSNGDNYDDFCEANKLKTSRIGLSIFLAEASNKDLIPINVIGAHAVKLVEIIEEIRANAVKISKESTENQIECVIRFFTLLAKTKLGRAGFRGCVENIGKILTREKEEKKLSPKSRFAIMDFVEDMDKKIKERSATASASASVSASASASASTTDIKSPPASTNTPAGPYRPKNIS